MGMFSWDCEVCHHPLLSQGATESLNGWMTRGVVLLEDGSIMHGEYDGYGCLNDNEIDGGQVYHQRCWELSGNPTKFVGESRSSRDQGWFFDNGVHNFAEPRTHAEALCIQSAGDMANKLCCQDWAMLHINGLVFSAEEILREIRDSNAVQGELLTKVAAVLIGLQSHVARENENHAKKEADRQAAEKQEKAEEWEKDLKNSREHGETELIRIKANSGEHGEETSAFIEENMGVVYEAIKAVFETFTDYIVEGYSLSENEVEVIKSETILTL